MTAFLQTLIIGIQVGAVYGLIALGLALVYKATRVFNFAHGEFGTLAVFAVWMLLPDNVFDIARDGGIVMPMFALAGVGLLVGGLLGVVTYLLIVRPLEGRPIVISLVATAGVTLLMIGFELYFGRAEPRSMPGFINGTAFRVLGIAVQWQTLFILAVLAVVALLLAAFFRSPLGTALLATAQEPFAASLYGISPRTMAVMTWGMAGVLAAVGGLLAVSSDRLLTPGVVTGIYLVPAFTAAILGGITSMPGAVVGGMLLGIIQASSNQYLPSTWPGRPQIGVFVILVVMLFLRPRGLLGKEA